jgi:hypothetical protein
MTETNDKQRPDNERQPVKIKLRISPKAKGNLELTDLVFRDGEDEDGNPVIYMTGGKLTFTFREDLFITDSAEER